MPRVTKKVKTEDFINEENKEIKKNNSKRKSVVSSKNEGKVVNKKNKEKTITSNKKSTPTKKGALKSNNKNHIYADSSTSSNALEYYDLPYRYNQTIVRILAQTPTTLFVYWDISDIDRLNFIEKYGKDFFNITKPVLLVHNKTKKSYFEVEINDFANSWYLHLQESDCQYEIELGRRNIENPSKYIYVSSSNQLISPNDHVLFEKSDFTNIKFKNVKTGNLSNKDFGSIRLMNNVGNIYNKKHKIYNFYNVLYKDEVLESNKMFSNPSSTNSTSGMF